MKGGEMEDVAGRGRGVSLIWERGGEGRGGEGGGRTVCFYFDVPVWTGFEIFCCEIAGCYDL